ncbi:hypothetical protein GCM10009799_38110 [Nocardiopsis rhodophaea]|uniref:Uncharacterized protein n=1 Tax=Nocardiopsis rhodophaea TaxID=280238 RepID=A0ABN3IDV8_9ACTN
MIPLPSNEGKWDLFSATPASTIVLRFGISEMITAMVGKIVDRVRADTGEVAVVASRGEPGVPVAAGMSGLTWHVGC